MNAIQRHQRNTISICSACPQINETSRIRIRTYSTEVVNDSHRHFQSCFCFIPYFYAVTNVFLFSHQNYNDHYPTNVIVIQCECSIIFSVTEKTCRQFLIAPFFPIIDLGHPQFILTQLWFVCACGKKKKARDRNKKEKKLME